MKNKLLILIFCQWCFAVQAQSWLWGKMGVSRKERYYGAGLVAADDKGNSYLAGNFSDSISFGGNLLKSNGIDAFLIKYDSTGIVKWAVQSNVQDSLNKVGFSSITSDRFGNIYCTGYCNDTAKFGSLLITNPQGYGDYFIIKYNSSGTAVWAKGAKYSDSFAQCNSNSIATDINGNVYVTGNFYETVTFDLYSVSCGGYYNPDVFLVKYDSNGNVLWAKQGNVPLNHNDESGSSLACDRLGNIYLAGFFRDTVTFGAFTLTIPYIDPEGSSFLVKYDLNGNVLWARQAKVPNKMSYVDACSVTVDFSGNALVSGLFADTVIFNSDTLRANGQQGEIFLTKYDANGNILWVDKSLSSNSHDWTGNSVASDSLNNIYLACDGHGSGSDWLSFERDTEYFNSNQYDPAVFFKLDSSGNVFCGEHIDKYVSMTTTAVSSSGKYVYLGGGFIAIKQTIILGKDTLQDNGNYGPPFIARWQPCDTIVQGIAGLENLKPGVCLFPNPNKGIFKLQIRNNSPLMYNTVEIYNMLGEKVFSTRLNSNNPQLDLSNNANGIYLYRVITNTGNLESVGKFVIQK